MKLLEESENISKISNLHEFSIDEINRELYLCNEINDDSVSCFLKNINYLDNLNHNPITIFAYSPGGETTAGLGIFDAIKLCKSYINYVCCGLAASMGSIIPQAADNRLIMPNATFMVHEGYMSLDLQQKAAFACMNWSKSMKEIIMEIYVSRCREAPYFRGKTKAYIKRFITSRINEDEDWYLTPEETVKFGFADKIYKGKQSLMR